MISVGSILRNAREEKKIGIHDVEKSIKVRAKFIEALERDDWTLFTSKIYINGILKNYSRFLDLDEKKILAFFRREYEKKEDLHFKERVSKRYFSPDSKKALWFGLSCIGIILFGYFLYQIYQFMIPPRVTLLKPNKTVFHREVAVQIVGKTEKEAVIHVLGERVFQDQNGIFEYLFPLKQKNNELIIEVVGANGKKTVFKKMFELLN